MDSLLRAVGCVAQGSRQVQKAASRETPGCRRRASPPAAARGKCLARCDEALVPDLAAVTKALEHGRLQLEQQARGLERASPLEACDLLRAWAQSLRRRPRPEESLASWRAQLLQSSALEIALGAMQRNRSLRAVLLDRPLFGGPGNVAGPEAEKLLAELRGLLQLCLPRAASGLADPVAYAALAGPEEGAAAAVSAVEAFKEDWADVVRSHAVRGMERRLDSLAYERQKSGLPSAVGEPRAVREEAALLALLCEVLGDCRVRLEEHTRELVGTLRALRLDAAAAALAAALAAPAAALAAPAGGLGGPVAPPAPPVSGAAEPAAEGAEPAAEPAEPGPCGGDCDEAATSEAAEPRPSSADCEAAVCALVSKTLPGVRDGLELLGLPSSPLEFVPGLTLRLRGHDVRSAVNAMICLWLEEDVHSFHEALRELRSVVSAAPAPPPPGDGGAAAAAVAGAPGGAAEAAQCPRSEEESRLRRQRAALEQERAVLLARLRLLGERVDDIDGQLAQLRAGATPGAAGAAAACCPAWPAPVPAAAARRALPPAPAPPAELGQAVRSSAEALGPERRRALERLGTQLQQRRAQLAALLAGHLQEATAAEAARLATPLLPGASLPRRGGRGALEFSPPGEDPAAATAGALGSALAEARELCARAGAVLGGPGAEAGGLHVGMRCRGRWMDGNFYDATVHSLGSDGAVLLNWLRPRPAGDGAPPLVTVSGAAGGDDTLHRFVPRADVLPVGASRAALVARELFGARAPEDRPCFDCSADAAEWASVSFGIYLCGPCAEAHRRLGLRQSLVRRLCDGLGWPQRDLEYLRLGGAAALRDCMQRHAPGLAGAPAGQRYTSRFAEFYRRRLDALCVGAQLPPPPAPEAAGQQGGGEFLTGPEAAAVAEEAAARLEARFQEPRRSRAAALPPPPGPGGAPATAR